MSFFSSKCIECHLWIFCIHFPLFHFTRKYFSLGQIQSHIIHAITHRWARQAKTGLLPFQCGTFSHALVTQTKPYCFPTVFQCLISVGFQLLISNHWNPDLVIVVAYRSWKNYARVMENHGIWFRESIWDAYFRVSHPEPFSTWGGGGSKPGSENSEKKICAK